MNVKLVIIFISTLKIRYQDIPYNVIMKLYVLCHECNNKIYINSEAKIRGELPYYFELKCFKGHQGIYYNSEVFAEQGFSNSNQGMVIGTILGAAVAGTAGAFIGGLLFGALGTKGDVNDKEAVERFNSSW